MVTNVTGRRHAPFRYQTNWEELAKDLAEHPEIVCSKYGYLSLHSAKGSLRNHEKRIAARLASRHQKPEQRFALPKESLVIPAEIKKQLIGVEMLPIDEMIIDPRFQRPEDTFRIRNMAEEWEWLACGFLAVNLRKGSEGKSVYSLIDGQQRRAAIKFQGFKEAPCHLYVDLSEEQEALLFEILNRNKKPGFNDLFKSRLFRGEAVAHAVNLAVEQSGYHLDPERRHSGAAARDSHYWIQSIVEVERMYRDGGGNQGGALHIMEVLKLIREVWAPEHLSKQSMILPGVALFLRSYKNFNRKELVEKLRRKGQLKVLQIATQWLAVHGSAVTNHSRGFCEAMVVIYNENRQEGNRIKSKFI